MARLTKSVNIGGKVISGNITRTGATDVSAQVTLAAGKAGNLTTRTSDSVGTLTLGASHGIVDGNIIDIYWSGGVRRGVTVGAVVGTAVPISLGSGSVLPADETAIIACVQTVLNLDFDGDEAIMVAASTTRRSSVHFTLDDDTNVLALDLGLSGTDGEAWDWHDDGSVTNPFAAVDVGKVKVSNGNATQTADVRVGAVLDNDV